LDKNKAYRKSCTNIRKPVNSKTKEKILFSFTASNFSASDAPTGANNTVSGTIQRKPNRLTKPNVPAGASLGVLPKVSIVNVAGNEIINPIAEAVPTDL